MASPTDPFVPAESPEPGYCHGVMAQLVAQPWRLADRRPGIGLDLDRLRGVVGQVTKVRHNPVRARLPLTFRTLSAAGAELAFFTDYAAEFTARRQDGIGDDERVEMFAAALHDWLGGTDDSRLIADVLDHELTLVAISGEPPVPTPQRDVGVVAGSKPRRRDGLRIRQLGVFPPELVEVLGCGGALDAVDRAVRWYAYVPTVLGPRIKQLAPECVPLVALADGTTTVDEMGRRLGVGERVTELAAMVEVLVHGGLMDIEPACD